MLFRLSLAACAVALSAWPALAQTAAMPTPANTMPATWSTDPGCGARALRVTFGGNALAIQRNGHTIYRGAAALAVSDDEIAVRLGSAGERNLIRFSRSGEAIRLVSALPGGAPHRVPPLYACRAAGLEAAAEAVVLPAAAAVPVP